MTTVYQLAPNPIFLTVQGEGELMGEPMVFLRLAGCSVGCQGCDTNYNEHRTASAKDIVREIASLSNPRNWVWITGGEPADQELDELVTELRRGKFYIALATSGHKQLPRSYEPYAVDFLSVSPHNPQRWCHFHGNELKLVPGLNGYRLESFAKIIDSGAHWFGKRYVSPCIGKPETVEECVEWVMKRPGWLMTCQAHKQWRIS